LTSRTRRRLDGSSRGPRTKQSERRRWSPVQKSAREWGGGGEYEVVQTVHRRERCERLG
jgi:hypothetical protein